MKLVSMIIAGLAVAALVALFVFARLSKSGQAPGIDDGRLARCPDSPNCVCSEYGGDTLHFIAPIKVPVNAAAAPVASARAAIVEQGGKIVAERPDYLAATYTSPLFGFVDDLEIRFDARHGLLQVRSASRVGRGDLGANRKRVERLRLRLFAEPAAGS